MIFNDFSLWMDAIADIEWLVGARRSAAICGQSRQWAALSPSPALERWTPGCSSGYRWLQVATGGCRWLQGVVRGTSAVFPVVMMTLPRLLLATLVSASWAQDIEVLSHICKYGVHSNGVRYGLFYTFIKIYCWVQNIRFWFFNMKINVIPIIPQ